jgi:adenine-specific DNA-methyltransferase
LVPGPFFDKLFFEEMATILQSAHLEERLRRRQLGAFYTPASIAEVLVQWALAGQPRRVLDPSFGGCVFLDFAARRLKALGVEQPGRFLCGVDIDADCLRHVEGNLLLQGTITVEGDFLALCPGNEEMGFFDVVTGNPPYVRHHLLTPEQRSSARSAATAAGVPLPLTSSLWAYFVIHSARFLKPNGRMAFVLPEAVLQAQYAAPVRKFLAQRFRHIHWVRLQERVFVGTDEAAVLLLAWGQGPGEETVHRASGIAELASLVNDLANSTAPTSEAEETLARVLTLPSILTLGEIAEIKIGIVTGANKFFILSEEEALRRGIASNNRNPVLAATRHLQGLQFSEQDGKDLVAQQVACQLLAIRKDSPLSASLRRWLEEGKRLGIHERHHCQIRRGTWFQIDSPIPPDAFATCCRSGSPLLVLNQARWRTTNTLHTVRFRRPVEPRAVAMGVLTTIASLAAELQGRRYGGGVLKMEPSSWRGLPVPLVDQAAEVFNEADRLLREGREEEARRLADRVVLVGGFGLAPSTVEDLRQQVSLLASWRRPRRSQV